METIGLVAAMTQERDALLRCVTGWSKIALGPFPGHCFELRGQTCVLVTCGMGIRRAGEAARCLLERVAPQALVSFGIAGAVEADLEIGDVVAAESAGALDQGVLGPLAPLAAWPGRQWSGRWISGMRVCTPGPRSPRGGPSLSSTGPGK